MTSPVAKQMTQPRERPIIFSGPMVRAILAGTKTQTRRVIRVHRGLDPEFWELKLPGVWSCFDTEANDMREIGSPYGSPGDRLWVRETWAEEEREDGRRDAILFAADTRPTAYGGRRFNDGSLFYGRWRSPLFMPRRFSRLTLEITAVRVERLQAISNDDVHAEGFAPWGDKALRFADTWDALNAKRGCGWAKDPWVWAVTFRRIT